MPMLSKKQAELIIKAQFKKATVARKVSLSKRKRNIIYNNIYINQR